MKATIDNFSSQAGGYARYRPSYPEALYTFVLEQVPNKQRAWDCGTGNGQVAARLAESFEEVYATDISEQQLAHAIRTPNIRYQVSRAEQTKLPDRSVQLITIAQALHWFDFGHFYQEVNRVAAPGAVVAALCYGLLQISPEMDEHIGTFYQQTLGPYWDKERELIDEAYATIPFPFEEMAAPAFTMHYSWNLEELTGYFNTWSSVQKYIRARQENPVTELAEKLKPYWGDETEKKTITFDLHMRIGRVK
ncbi:SAM-dependent methyltransferase [Pontibacter sp. HJ8]